MLSQERQSLILDIIKEQGSVTVTRLTEILQSSESTVRRDLSYLASKGKINKVHGGATALGQEFIKLEDNIEEKLTVFLDLACLIPLMLKTNFSLHLKYSVSFIFSQKQSKYTYKST